MKTYGVSKSAKYVVLLLDATLFGSTGFMDITESYLFMKFDGHFAARTVLSTT